MVMNILQPFLPLNEVLKPKPDEEGRKYERKSFRICLTGVSSYYALFSANCFVSAV
jgi:hypothetical protein